MDGALDRADTALHRFDGAAALDGYEAALAKGPDRAARAAAGRVRALWLLRRWDEARVDFAKIADRTDSVPVELARGILALGQPDDPAWFCVDSGSAQRDDSLAAQAFRAAIRLDATCAEAVAGYATAIRMSGRVADAQQVLADASEPLQASAPVQVERAMCAVELSKHTEALESVGRALEVAPDDMHAQLVRLSVLRRSERGSEKCVRAAEVMLRAHVNPPAALLESYGWALADWAGADSDPLSKEKRFRRARDAFRQSMTVGPVIPGAVHGVSYTYLEHDDFDAAMEVVDEAIAREPTSPQLHRCRADIITVSGGTPQQTLNAYRRVLDLDPRDLGARIQMVSALYDLDQVVQARTIVTTLSDELPGNNEVAVLPLSESSTSEFVTVHTRVERPWESGQDDQHKVLDLLINEIIAVRKLKPEAADRLRNSLKEDPDTRRAVLERAYEEEQEYLHLRNDHLAAKKRSENGAQWRVFGWSACTAGCLVAIVGLGRLVWLLASPLGLGTGWMWVITIGAFVVAVALTWSLDRILLSDVVVGAMLAAGLALLAACIWQGILLLGVGAGIAYGVGAAGVIVGAIFGGIALAEKFSPPFDDALVQNAFDIWLEVLYKRGVEPAANEAISRPGRVYGTSLSAGSTTKSVAAVDIDTKASRELRDLLKDKDKRGGNFALAGPRGAGKTTLLERWCAGSFLRAEDGTQEARHDLIVRVDAPVEYKSQDFLIHLFGQSCRAVERYAEDHKDALRKLAPPTDDRSTRASAPLRRLMAPDLSHPSDHDLAGVLIRRARKERRSIRFVMSHTAEGELSLGLPRIASALGRVSQRWDKLPLNHPELVNSFCEFLGDIAEVVSKLNGKVLVGIDELDRISDSKRAQLFVNELKAVFKAKNCYFLVSVSEDALADFELAAMGMRTVFDSAFTKIIRVDYLNFNQARVLLHRRIPDITEQFIALAYVMSGGLMRELCRRADEIGTERTTPTRTLDYVAKQLVEQQMARTARAAVDRLGRSSDRTAGAALIPVLDEHPQDELSAATLRAYSITVRKCAPADGEPELVTATRLDVAVMAEYLAVLLDIFNDRLDRNRMQIGHTGNLSDFETLARVRRYLGANPNGARQLLLAFSKAWHLEDVSAPMARTLPVTPSQQTSGSSSTRSAQPVAGDGEAVHGENGEQVSAPQ